MALTPQWLTETPSKFILGMVCVCLYAYICTYLTILALLQGETVVAIRCAVNPIPEEPTAIVVR